MPITTTFVPDAYLVWLWKQSIRATATLVALGIITFLLSLVCSAIAAMIDALHAALHQIVLFCISINSTFTHSGLIGQAVMICLVLFCLGWFAYRGYCYIRGGQA